MNRAFTDIKESMFRHQVWLLLAWQDIKLRYRRSTIGPFWLTLSMAITIYTMGFLYAKLFKMDTAVYFPYLAAGMISWQFISTIVTEATVSFLAAEGYLKEIKLPAPIFIMRLVARNVIILLHTLPVFLPLFIFLPIPVNFSTLLFIPGLIILVLNGFAYGTLLALIGARFRDIAQIITSLTQIIFFMTPVIWMTSILPPAYQWATKFNPFYVFIELIRLPLLGQTPTLFIYGYGIICTILGYLVLFLIYPRYRGRIIYWL